jgi:hypothetical protein
MSFTSFEAAQRRANIDEARRNPKASDMSLRDYFASKAMQALIHSFGYREGDNIVIPNNVSDHSYTLADQMLKVRK